MTEITFRTGTSGDVLARLHESAGPPGASQSVGSASPQDLILLAEFHDHVVGYLAASPDRFGGLVVWEHVVVPQYRDRGIGRRLLLEAARRSPPNSRITIDPTGEFAINKVSAYYARLGFPDAPDDQFKVSIPAHIVVDAIGERVEEHTTLRAILRHKSSEVVTVDPAATIADAVALLDDGNIGCVVVSSDGSSVDGILSERDLVIGLRSRDAGVLLESYVRDHMTAEVVQADVSDLIADVMEIMTLRRLRHLPVTDDAKLIGIVSVGDLLVFRMREHDMRRDALPFRQI